MECLQIPAISVITPVYNAENYLPECLDSVKNQCFPDLNRIKNQKERFDEYRDFSYRSNFQHRTIFKKMP